MNDAAKSNAGPVNISLPDGSVRTFDGAVTGADIAADIGPGLAKAALAVRINGELEDLDIAIAADAEVAIVTRKDDDALELIRHDAAHIMAMAVQELFPGTQVTIGPAIEDGFYYDFARNEPFHAEDLDKIELRMKEIVDRNVATTRQVWDRDEAVAHFKELGESYKAELIEAIPAGDPIKIYYHGEWHDLCRGPHLQSTGKIGKAFKLTKLAGAYWRGDSNNAQLQRIYGTAWRDDKELKAYLHRIEEAEKRDHRKVGREMDLFHLQEEAHGSVFWHPKGFVIYNQLEAYIRRRLNDADYVEVKTPQVLDSKFWEQSGHWEKFRENMFVVPDEIPSTDEDAPVLSGAADKLMALKPMNCPAHIQIFKHDIRSYRDLPLRMAEFGCCHRNEPHGALHGLMRVRQMTQDDAHIFCREDQVESESIEFCNLLFSVYEQLGFTDIAIKLATRPELRAGANEVWDKAEAVLEAAVKAAGLSFEYNVGEGAFYDPKLEIVLKDAIGRDWQCGTLQLDFVLPERLDAAYIGPDGERHRPAMLHRAILGTLERFIGVLIEHHAGRFPVWLAPVQVVVATITSDANDYAERVHGELKAAGLRAELDIRNEKINFKVREHSHGKVPLIFVVGKREAEEGTVSVRRLGQKDQEILALREALTILKTEAMPPDLAKAQ
jgi:threonyl-tRNA synthetase